MPGQPFSYSFMDNHFNNIYQADQQTGNCLSLCSVRNFNCMPWFIWVGNLCSGTTHKRNWYTQSAWCKCKRDCNHAFKRFCKAGIDRICYCISCCMVGNEQMVAKFCIPDKISWWVFVVAGIISCSIALITVSFQAIKAAIANPVRRALRTE